MSQNLEKKRDFPACNYKKKENNCRAVDRKREREVFIVRDADGLVKLRPSSSYIFFWSRINSDSSRLVDTQPVVAANYFCLCQTIGWRINVYILFLHFTSSGGSSTLKKPSWKRLRARENIEILITFFSWWEFEKEGATFSRRVPLAKGDFTPRQTRWIILQTSEHLNW